MIVLLNGQKYGRRTDNKLFQMRLVVPYLYSCCLGAFLVGCLSPIDVDVSTSPKIVTIVDRAYELNAPMKVSLVTTDGLMSDVRTDLPSAATRSDFEMLSRLNRNGDTGYFTPGTRFHFASCVLNNQSMQYIVNADILNGPLFGRRIAIFGIITKSTEDDDTPLIQLERFRPWSMN